MTILDDVRHAARALWRSKGFTLMASLTLALALGLTTPIFSMMDAMWHPYTPIKDPDRVIVIQSVGPPRFVTAWERYRLMRDGTHFAEQMVPVVRSSAEIAIPRWRGQFNVQSVPAAYFEMLGITPVMGRSFNPTGSDEGAIILGLEWWRQLFADRKTLDGAKVTVNGQAYSVVGVMPERTGDAFLVSDPERPPTPSTRWVTVTARVKAGVGEDQVRRELSIVANQITLDHGDRRRPARFEVSAGGPAAEGGGGPISLFGLTGLAVLTIACSNLTNLMLVRGASRRRDTALRLALGGSRAGIVRQLASESLMIAAAGGVGGAILGLWGISLMRHVVPQWSGVYSHYSPYVSWRSFAFLFVAASIVGIIAGVYPGLRASEVHLDEPLKEHGGGVTRRTHRRHAVLAILELSLALPLLLVTSFFVRNYVLIDTYKFGFDPDRTLMGTVNLPCAPQDRLGSAEMFAHATAITRGQPGVVGVAGFSFGGSQPVVPDVPLPPQRMERAVITQASAGFDAVLSVPMVAGRSFVPGDFGDRVAIVDQSAALRLWGAGVNPLGHTFKIGQERSADPWIRVIGVVQDFESSFRMGLSHDPAIFVLPDTARVRCGFTLAVRVADQASIVMPKLERQLDDGMGVRYPTYFRTWRVASYWTRARDTWGAFSETFGVLGGCALALAAVGLYGVLAFGVGQRRREFGVRMALGATRGDVFRSVVRHGFTIVLAGTALGAFVAIGAGYVVGIRLMSMNASIVASLVPAEIALCLVAFLACLAPARRAMSADPAEILRAV